MREFKVITEIKKYLDNNWHIFPVHYPQENGLCSCKNPICTSQGKHPLTAHGFKDATTDIKQIKEWIKQYPNANWGIRTGRESNLIVLDVDGQKGGFESMSKYQMPFSFYTLTGNGWHAYFKFPKGIEYASSVNILTGVDIRANNGYVVAPPSKHINGNFYEIYCNDKLTYPPDCFCELINNKQEQKKVDTKKPDFFFEGQRNNALFRWGIYFVNNHSTNQHRLFAFLKKINQKRCVPPLLNFEVLQITNNILNTKNTKTGKPYRFT